MASTPLHPTPTRRQGTVHAAAPSQQPAQFCVCFNLAVIARFERARVKSQESTVKCQQSSVNRKTNASDGVLACNEKEAFGVVKIKNQKRLWRYTVLYFEYVFITVCSQQQEKMGCYRKLECHHAL